MPATDEKREAAKNRTYVPSHASILLNIVICTPRYYHGSYNDTCQNATQQYNVLFGGHMHGASAFLCACACLLAQYMRTS